MSSALQYRIALELMSAFQLRAAFVSVNLFSLLCEDGHIATPIELGQISKYGGPVLYLVLYGVFLFGILVWEDSGSIFPRRKTWLRRAMRQVGQNADVRASELSQDDVTKEANTVATSDDILKVLDIVKAFGGPSNRVVDEVSFGVGRDTIFALLGPNGAGKTTTFNVIREFSYTKFLP